MYGSDLFAIRKGKFIVAEPRGGYYLIALSINKNKVNFEELAIKDYKEELSRFKQHPDKFIKFDSIMDYIHRGKGDVLFYLTPKSTFVIGQDGSRDKLQTHIKRRR